MVGLVLYCNCAAEARWQGNTQELKVEMLIATPVDENDLGHQLWIGKVLDMVMHKNQHQIKSTPCIGTTLNARMHLQASIHWR